MSKYLNKTDVIVFASISFLSFCYIIFFDKNNNKSKRKIDREIDETIKQLSKNDNGNIRNDDARK